MAYWLSVFTGNTWEEFLAAGASTAGFPDNPRGPHRRMEPGDVLLCYVCGVSRWIGALEVTGEAYSDDTPIWSERLFPIRASRSDQGDRPSVVVFPLGSRR
jgi:hypothetical protein